MAVLKAWTTTQLTKFGLWLAKAFGADTVTPNTVNDTWTAESLCAFGLEMSKGFGGGL